MQVALPDASDSPRPSGRRRWSAGLAAALLLVASALPLSTPAFAQFGLNLGGLRLNLGGGHGGSGGGWGNRGGYGYGRGAGPSRPGGMMGRQPRATRPPTNPYPKPSPTKPTWPGKGGVYGDGGRPRPGYPPGTHRPRPLPPWGTRPGYPVRPPPYRPPVVVQGDPPRHRPPVVVQSDPPRYRPPYRPRRPIVVAQPPTSKPLRLAPLRPMRPIRAAPPAAPPVARRPPPARPVPPAPAPAPVVASDGTYVDREILVELAGGQPAGAIDRIAARNGLTRLGSTELTLAGTTVHRLRINGRRSVDSVVAALGRDGSVALAQRNHLYRLTVDAGQAYYPLSSSQYAAAKLHLAEAHRLATGEGVTVAVIDSGVDTAHPELQGAIGGNENTLSSDATPDQHGTAIAGAIAARGQLMGVAPGTRILAIRAFSPATTRSQAEGTSWDVVRAVDLAGKAGAKVVNMSFAGPADRLMSREVAGGLRRGIVFVAAAGNAGAAAPPAYPAAEPGVIAVTATDLQDRLYESANRGSYVAVAAPGVDVLVASPGSGYDTSTGTSVAAAHVSGIVALMLQRYGSLSPAAIRAALAARAKDLGPPGPDPEFGAGLVDAYAALGGEEVPVASAPPAAQGSPPPAPVASAEPGRFVPASGPPAVQGSPPPAPEPVTPAAGAPAPQGSPPPAPVASAEPARPVPVSNPPPAPVVQGSPPAPLAAEPAPPASGAGAPPPAAQGSPPSAPVASAEPARPLPVSNPPPAPVVQGSPPAPPVAEPPPPAPAAGSSSSPAVQGSPPPAPVASAEPRRAVPATDPPPAPAQGSPPAPYAPQPARPSAAQGSPPPAPTASAEPAPAPSALPAPARAQPAVQGSPPPPPEKP